MLFIKIVLIAAIGFFASMAVIAATDGPVAEEPAVLPVQLEASERVAAL